MIECQDIFKKHFLFLLRGRNWCKFCIMNANQNEHLCCSWGKRYPRVMWTWFKSLESKELKIKKADNYSILETIRERAKNVEAFSKTVPSSMKLTVDFMSADPDVNSNRWIAKKQVTLDNSRNVSIRHFNSDDQELENQCYTIDGLDARYLLKNDSNQEHLWKSETQQKRRQTDDPVESIGKTCIFQNELLIVTLPVVSVQRRRVLSGLWKMQTFCQM